MYKNDEWGEVVNHPDTYKDIAQQLIIHKCAIAGWTDQRGTHFDILFSLKPVQLGTTIQGGLRPRSDLFVSIMRIGAFAFTIKERGVANVLHEGYVDEKLGNRTSLGGSRTQVTALVNGVIKELVERGE